MINIGEVVGRLRLVDELTPSLLLARRQLTAASNDFQVLARSGALANRTLLTFGATMNGLGRGLASTTQALRGIGGAAGAGQGPVRGLGDSMMGTATVASFLGNTLAMATMRATAFFKDIVMGSAQAGLRLEQLEVATRFLGEGAGYTGKFIDDLANRIEKTGITATAARESIQSLLGAHIPLDKAEELSAIAQNMQALAGGRSSSEVFQVMTRALATGNTEILRSVGFQNMAISQLNKTGQAMTGTARAQAILNGMIKEGTEKMGLYGASMTTAGKQASSAERAWAQVSEQLGRIMLPITSRLIKAWYALGQEVRDRTRESGVAIADFVEGIGRKLDKAIDKAKEWGNSFQSAARTAIDAADSTNKAMEYVPQPVKNIGLAFIEATVGIGLLEWGLKKILGLSVVRWLIDTTKWVISLGRAFVAMMPAHGIAGFDWAPLVAGLKATGAALLAFAATPAGIFVQLVALAVGMVKVADAIVRLYEAYLNGESMWDFFFTQDEGNAVTKFANIENAAEKAAKAMNRVPREPGKGETIVHDQAGEAFTYLKPGDTGTGEYFEGPAFQTNDRIPEMQEKIEELDRKAKQSAERVKEMFEEWRKGDKSLGEIQRAYSGVTKEMRANHDVLGRVVEGIHKLHDSGVKLTNQNKQDLADYRAMHKARLDDEQAMLRRDQVTLKSIEADERRGLSLREIAEMHSVSTEAVERHKDALEHYYDALVKNVAASLEFHDSGGKLTEDQKEDIKLLTDRTHARIEDEKATLEANGVTLDSIEAEQQLGYTLQRSAAIRGMSTEGLEAYVEKLKEGVEVTKLIASASTEGARALVALGDALKKATPTDRKKILENWGVGEEARQDLIRLQEDVKATTTLAKAQLEALRDYKLALTKINFDKPGAVKAIVDAGKAYEARIGQAAIEDLERANNAADEFQRMMQEDGERAREFAQIARRDLGSALSDLVRAFADLAQATGRTDGVIAKLARAMGLMSIAAQAGEKMNSAINKMRVVTYDAETGLKKISFKPTVDGFLQIATAAVTAAAAMVQATDVAGRWNRALAGAMTGQAIGQQLGGKTGGIIGFIIGGFYGLIKTPAFEQVTKTIGRQAGINISEGLARAIAEDATHILGGGPIARRVASLLHLNDVIAEGGGLNTQNIGRMTTMLLSTFTGLENHTITTAQAMEVLEENWDNFAKAGTDATGRLSDGLRQVLQLAIRTGTMTAAMTSYVKAQGVASLGFMNDIVAGSKHITEAAEKNAASIKTTREEIDKLRQTPAERRGDEDNKKLADAEAELTRLLAEQKDMASRSRDELADVGAIAVSSFATALASGASFFEALQAGKDGITTLAKAYRDLGIDAEESGLKTLIVQGRILENSPQLLQAAQALGSNLTAMGNIGALTTGALEATQRQGMRLFTQLQREAEIALGANANASEINRQALLGMQSYLHAAAKAAEDLHVPLDENTQLMIDQSKELGIWKEIGDPTTLLTKGIYSMIAAVERLTKVLQGIPVDPWPVDPTMPDPTRPTVPDPTRPTIPAPTPPELPPTPADAPAMSYPNPTIPPPVTIPPPITLPPPIVPPPVVPPPVMPAPDEFRIPPVPVDLEPTLIDEQDWHVQIQTAVGPVPVDVTPVLIGDEIDAEWKDMQSTIGEMIGPLDDIDSDDALIHTQHAAEELARLGSTPTDDLKAGVEDTKGEFDETTSAITGLIRELLRIPNELPNPFRGWTMPVGPRVPLDEEQHATGGYVGESRFRTPTYAGNTPYRASGSDTVPAMLTPGELVLNASQQRMVADNLTLNHSATTEVNQTPVLISVSGRGKTDEQIVEDVMRQWPGKAGRNEFGIRMAVLKIVKGN